MNKRIFYSAYDLYKLCVDNMLVTCSSVQQYDKLFNMSQSGFTRDELVQILYLFSDVSYGKIEKVVDKLVSDLGVVGDE